MDAEQRREFTQLRQSELKTRGFIDKQFNYFCEIVGFYLNSYLDYSYFPQAHPGSRAPQPAVAHLLTILSDETERLEPYREFGSNSAIHYRIVGRSSEQPSPKRRSQAGAHRRARRAPVARDGISLAGANVMAPTCRGLALECPAEDWTRVFVRRRFTRKSFLASFRPHPPSTR